MRQIISTAVVAVVGAVAGATMGAMAQSGPEATAQQAIVPGGPHPCSVCPLN